MTKAQYDLIEKIIAADLTEEDIAALLRSIEDDAD